MLSVSQAANAFLYDIALNSREWLLITSRMTQKEVPAVHNG